MAINIRAYDDEKLESLIKTNEGLSLQIDKYSNQIKTNTTEWHPDDTKTFKTKLSKALKYDVMKYINKKFNVKLGFGYTQATGIFIGITNTGNCFFFVGKNEVAQNVVMNSCFYTSVDYIVKNLIDR